MGMTMAGGSNVATFTGEAVGRSDSSGSISWRGFIFYKTSSTGSLSFLNNLVEVFETQIDAAGNFSHKAWDGNRIKTRVTNTLVSGSHYKAGVK
jgi:hypothetical protein